jgi:hypothetical protein
MKRNAFIAALESEVPGTVGPEDVTNQSTLQPKPGVGEEKGGEPSLDDVKAKKEFGEEHDIADHDEIDTVAESQEHTLALEHLQAAAVRFCRMGAALEEIAETAAAQLDAGQPMTPETVAMVTTGLDAAGIGEPLEESVALESFGFDAKIATESFIEAIKDRAQQVWAAVAKFAKKAFEVTAQKMKRFADYFRSLPSVYAKLEKEGEILASNAGKPFQNAKWEKALQDRFYAPASTKSPVAAVDNALSEFDEITKLVDVKLAGDIRGLSSSWSTDKPEQVVAAMNKCLATARLLTEMGASRFKHSSVKVEVNLPERVTLDGTGGLEGTRVVFEEGTSDFSAGIRTATVADIKHLKDSAVKADRAFTAIWDAFGALDFEPKYKARSNYGSDDREVARKLLVKYSNLMRVLCDLMAGCAYGAADGVYSNHYSATKWIRFSIAEAKAAGREGGAKE